MEQLRQKALFGEVNNNWIKELVKESGAFTCKGVQMYMCKNGFENLMFMRGINDKIDVGIKIEQMRLFDMKWEDILEEIPDESPNPLHASIAESLSIFHRIMEFQKIDPCEFVNNTYKIMNRLEIKYNMYVAKGDKNSGKTLVLLSIVKSTKSGVNVQKFDESSNFCLAPMINARCALWNEPRISDKMIETMKNIAEGMEVPADQKWEKNSMLGHCPTFVATNNDLCHYSINKKKNEETMSARYTMDVWSTMDELKHFRKHLNPKMWKYLLQEYVFSPVVENRAEESFDDFINLENEFY